MSNNPIQDHRDATRSLARSLRGADVYHWLIEHGYFPESYVLPPCFKVVKKPEAMKKFYDVGKKSGHRSLPIEQLISVHFPKSEFTDR